MVVVFPAVTKRVIDEVLIEKHPGAVGDFDPVGGAGAGGAERARYAADYSE
jgi:hypothetical protein